MDIHKWKDSELNKLLMEKFGFKTEKKYILEEDQDRIFAPNHYCAHHVIHEGLEAYTVDHNWDAEKQQVTKYDIRFRDGTIKRNVHVSDLEILEAFNEGSHSGNRDEHPPVKDASKDKKDDSEVKDKEKADLDDDGKLSGYEKKRAKAIEDSMEEQDKKKKNLEEAGTKRVKELADDYDISFDIAQDAMAMMSDGKSEEEAVKMAKKKSKEKKNESIYRKKVRKLLGEALKRSRRK